MLLNSKNTKIILIITASISAIGPDIIIPIKPRLVTLGIMSIRGINKRHCLDIERIIPLRGIPIELKKFADRNCTPFITIVQRKILINITANSI